MRYSSVSFFVRYSMRALLAIILLYSLSMLLCCMEGSDKTGITFDDKFDLLYSNNLRKQRAKNASRLNEKRIWAQVHKHSLAREKIDVRMMKNQKQYHVMVWYLLFHECYVFVSWPVQPT